MKDRIAAQEFWDREISEHTYTDWMSFPPIRAYLNTLIGGSEHDWPFNWFVRFLNGRTFGRALSIGCGSGALERDVIRRGLCRHVDAFDGSVGSLAIAREEAAREGYGDRIHYFAADFNEPSLPRSAYDAVFFHHSLHHVAKLEKLLRAVMLALKPGGLLYLDEYLGPSRTWWTDERFTRQRALYLELVPPEARTVASLPLPIVYSDPSEAVRSGEILPQLAVGFDLVEFRGYGGPLLSVICNGGIQEGHLTEELAGRLIAAEQTMLRQNADHYFGIVVATPKRGLAGRLASLRYFAEPKAKRIGRELRGIFRR